MNGLTIGALDEQAKVHVETIHYYERRGLIEEPPVAVTLKAQASWVKNRRRAMPSVIASPLSNDVMGMMHMRHIPCPRCPAGSINVRSHETGLSCMKALLKAHGKSFQFALDPGSSSRVYTPH